MKTIDRGWRRLRKRLKGQRRRVLLRAAKRFAAMPTLWLRLRNEATACPACGSPDLDVLDVFRVRGDLTGNRLTFLTGCEGCGLLFSNPLPSAERLAQYYEAEGDWGEAHADRAARLTAAHERQSQKAAPAKTRSRRRRALFDALRPYVDLDRPPAGARAIDFGCGDGKLLNSLQECGWQTFGIEPSMDVAFLSHGRLQAPPQDGDFDLAILHHVLEHVPNPLEVLTQLAGTLRDGGVLFISVPRFDTVAEHQDLRYCINGRNHVMCFTDACLRHLLARAGFEVLGTLHSPELDAVLTKGQPLRMRVVARRTRTPPPPPPAPLRAARRALAAYARARLPVTTRVAAALPLRLRAGWMQWTLTR